MRNLLACLGIILGIPTAIGLYFLWIGYDFNVVGPYVSAAEVVALIVGVPTLPLFFRKFRK